MKVVIINASNLHSGGGVQVAVSFLTELSALINHYPYKDVNFKIIVSTAVKNNLPIDVNFDCIREINVFGFKVSRESKKILKEKCDIFFTVFGPLYFKSKSRVELTGFAQPWIAYPDNLAYKKLNPVAFIKNKLTFYIKGVFFRKSNKYIVEAEHVKNALVYSSCYSEHDIYIVSNTVSSIYDDTSKWKPVDFCKTNNFTLGFIGRAYSHKNLNILKSVNETLIRKYNITCQFVFTLTEQEMIQCGLDREENFISVGPISVEQCPSFYTQIDALIFPSLLECFSATPVEAMKMETLVLASDLPFIRGVCGDAARYFDPMDEESIALAIFNATEEREHNKLLVKKGLTVVKALPSAKDRAQSYLNILLNL